MRFKKNKIDNLQIIPNIILIHTLAEVRVSECQGNGLTTPSHKAQTLQDVISLSQGKSSYKVSGFQNDVRANPPT
jgi:hypothetical protein